MITDKLTQSIAEAYKKMKEELVGGQKKLDVNKNNEVDSQDLAILRAKKKELGEGHPANLEAIKNAAKKPHSPNQRLIDRNNRLFKNTYLDAKERNKREREEPPFENPTPAREYTPQKGQKTPGEYSHVKGLVKGMLNKEETELYEGKMGELHAHLGELLDKHIDAFRKSRLGHDQFGDKVIHAHGVIAKSHGLKPEHAQKFVNDYVDSHLDEEYIDEGNKENKQKKNEYVASIIQKKLHPSVLPSLKYGRRELKKEEIDEEFVTEGYAVQGVRKHRPHLPGWVNVTRHVNGNISSIDLSRGKPSKIFDNEEEAKAHVSEIGSHLSKQRGHGWGPLTVQKVRGKATTNEEVEHIDELSNKLLKNYTKKVKDEHDAIVDAEMQMPYDRLNPLKSSRYKGYTRASSILHNRRINKEEIESIDEAEESNRTFKYSDKVPVKTSKEITMYRHSNGDHSIARNRDGKQVHFGTKKSATELWNDIHSENVKEEVEVLDEKAVSQAQQKFMGMVHATQKGDMKAPSPEVAKAAGSMTKKAAKDFASTKLTGLPKHVDEETELDETSQVTKYLKNKYTIGVGATKAQYQGPRHELNRIAALQKGREILKGKKANEEVEDIEEAKKSPWDKLNSRLKSHGYDADEVLKRPAPEQKKDEKPSEKEKTNEELSREASTIKEVYHRAKAEAKAKDARRGGPQSSKKKENFDSEPEMDILPIASERSGKKKL